MVSLADLLPSIGLGEIIIFAILLFIGLVVILLLRALIHFIVPIVAAIVVWFLTQSLIYAGASFVIVAILQLALRRKR